MNSETAGILEDLVNQFSDPMSCLRELIQNAIDAGSGEVVIDVEYDKGEGLLTLHVNDFGEGMTQEIIETKLTRLFSSGKDEDFTKIGRFGIGFVSVFALKPFLVCVDTGRAGEYWRVLFKEDRTYDLIALDHPVEGTQIRLFKRMTSAQADAFKARAREVIAYWCRHVSVPILFDGQEINEPFELGETVCQVRYEEEGTRIVAGFVRAGVAKGGFFNRGLTLKDELPSEWIGVAFKIDSRYLEHTLTRDQVLKDGHYEKAHALLDRVIREELVHKLIETIGAAASDPKRRKEWHVLLIVLNGWLKSWGESARLEREPMVATLYGEPMTPRAMRKRVGAGEVLFAKVRDALSDVLAQREGVTIVGGEGARYRSAFDVFMSRMGMRGALEDVSTTWVMVQHATAHHAPGARVLRDELRVAFKALGGAVESIDFIAWVGEGRREELATHRMVVCGVEPLIPVKRGSLEAVTRARLFSAKRLGLFASYELTVEAMRLAIKEPEWAALLVVKALLLQDDAGMRAVDEGVATAHMVQRRERRLTKHARRTR